MNTIPIFTVALLALTISSGLPAPITVSVIGHVTNVSEYNIATGVSVGDPVTWTAVYNVNSPDGFNDGGGQGPYVRYDFFTAPTSITLDVRTLGGTLSFLAGPAVSGDFLSVWLSDRSPFNLMLMSAFNTSGANWPVLIPGGFYESLIDVRGGPAMLNGIALPVAGLPDRSLITSFSGVVRGHASSAIEPSYDIAWTLDQVPEPSAMLLLLSSSLTIALRRIRQ